MSLTLKAATGILLLALAASPALAQDRPPGPITRLANRIRQHHQAPAGQASVPVTAATQADCACETGQDPYGFTGILNRFRAAAGLQPVAYDPQLSSWASQNNAVQSQRGIGHHYNPCGTQNCGWNYTDAQTAAQGWMESPGHRRNMLSPTVSRIGIAYGPGPYWTLNLR